MNQLTDIPDATFEELVEIGRSIIPTVAPAWTDHNVHDPGIMLMELLAWTAEAQTYALGHVRRDERYAYARLLGLKPRGPRPAAGLIWPGTDEPSLPASGIDIYKDAPATIVGHEAPAFRVDRALYLSPARLDCVQTEFADGSNEDWTGANNEPGVVFAPFGDNPAHGTRLILRFKGTLLGDAKGKTTARHWPLGVRVAPGNGAAADSACDERGSPLTVAVRFDHEKHQLPIVDDTTLGLRRSGILLLDLSALAGVTQSELFTVEITAGRGTFARAPRLDRIAPNVIGVTQCETLVREPGDTGTGQPDQVIELGESGLMFGDSDRDVTVKVPQIGDKPWKRVEDLKSSGPDDTHYTADFGRGRIVFGNGVNGRIPPLEAGILIDGHVCAGTKGNLVSGHLWTVRGAGAYGTNPDAMTGGSDATTLDDLKRSARKLRESHPLVTRDDLQKAALALDLGVARAHEIDTQAGASPALAPRLLVVLEKRVDAQDAATTERAAWLREIERRLSVQVPMGQRLKVIAPRYVAIAVRAEIVLAPKRDPKAVTTEAEKEIRRRLDLTGQTPAEQWPFGRAVAALEIKTWLLKVKGVARVDALELKIAGKRESANKIAMTGAALPRLGPDAVEIVVKRAGGARP